MALSTYRIFHISDDPADINNMQLCCQDAADADLGYKMWCGKDDDGHITRWLSKDEAARVTSLNISGLTAIASLVKTDGLGNLSAGQISIATLNSFLSDGPIPTCPVVTAGEVVYGGGSAGTPIDSISTFFYDTVNDFLGINQATPECGLHIGSQSPSSLSGTDQELFVSGNAEFNSSIYVDAWIYGYSYDPGTIPYFNSSNKLSEATSNLYYTEDTLGLKVTPTDDDATLDIIAAPVYSASGGGATINITATSSGAHFGNINIDSSGDALLHASNDLTMRAGATSKSAIFMNPDTDDSIRFQTPYTYSSWVKTYLSLAETQTEEATYVGNFGEASILDAMNQLYTLASGAGSGDVVGPGSSTDNAVARFDGTTGKLIQNSTVLLSDGGAFSSVAHATYGTPTSASFATNTITVDWSGSNKPYQAVTCNADVTALSMTAPDGSSNGLIIKIIASGEIDLYNIDDVSWAEGSDLSGGSGITVADGTWAAIHLYWDGSEYIGWVSQEAYS